MINSIKARTPILVLILFVFAVGYTVAAKVVVIPLGGDSQPSGMVSAFSSMTCPTGWTKYTNAQGRFVVGLNDGGTLGYTRVTKMADKGGISHAHRWGSFDGTEKRWFTFNAFGGLVNLIDWFDGMDTEGIGHYPLAPFDQEVTKNYYTEQDLHTPPYVQLLYCEKV